MTQLRDPEGSRKFPNFSVRSNQLELMEDPQSDRTLLYSTLKQFEFINRYFLSLRKLTKRIMIPAMSANSERPIRVLDLGCGGCDFALWLNRQFEKRGISVEITGIDNDPRIVDYAEKAVSSHQNIRIIQCDAFEIENVGESFDYVFCSNFLHHLTDEEIHQLLLIVMKLCDKGFLAVDLHRSAVPYYLFSMFSLFFLRNSFARADGKTSIQRGFVPTELEKLIQKSGFTENTKVKKSGLTDLYFFWRAE